MARDNRTTRREFLTARPVDSTSSAEDQTPASIASGRDPHWQSSYLSVFSKNAMGCEFAIFLNADQFSQGPDTAMLALEEIDRLEAKMTVYSPSSELSLINQTAHEGPVAIGSDLTNVIAKALQIFRQTAGAFDPTAGPLSRIWGFHDRKPVVPQQTQIDAALGRIGGANIRLLTDERSILFEKSGVEINLGGIGKGYALDQCAQLFDQAGVTDFVIHGGQSSVIAGGNRSAVQADDATGWVISVSHPLLPDTTLGNVHLQDRALATSGSGRQSLFHKGKRLGHIIDPRTGWPPDNVLSTTVLAPCAAEADALATAFFVMGVEESRAYCEQHPEVGAIFVCQTDRQSSVETTTIQLSESDWRAT